MKYKCLFIIVFLSVSIVNIYGQAGYKNFRFNMSLDEVRRLCTGKVFEKSEEDDPYRRISSKIFTVISYFNKCTHDQYIIWPRNEVEGFIYINHYYSYIPNVEPNQSEMMYFFFHDNKLKIIIVSNYYNPRVTLNDLRNSYGVPFEWKDIESRETAYFYLYTQDKNRYVLNYIRAGTNNDYIIQNYILFIDRNWADNICLTFYKNYMEEQRNRTKNILD